MENTRHIHAVMWAARRCGLYYTMVNSQLTASENNNMIISGGVNIYPQEIEHVLMSHPFVLDAAVFGVPDDDMGQSICAVVELVDPAPPPDRATEALSAWMQSRLARYKWPRTLTFDRIPRNEAGKLNKRSLIDAHLHARPAKEPTA